MKNLSDRGLLQVREPDGTTAFYPTHKVLLSPELRARCTEKRQLRAIIRDAGKLENTQ